MKLRERFQTAGIPDEYAQQAVIVVMDWLSESSSLANRHRMDAAGEVAHALREEEISISPPRGDVPDTFDEVAAAMTRVQRPPRVVRAGSLGPSMPPPSN